MEEETKERPNYYSVIPASVRYDKNIKANEKLLYSEITVLCNKNGYCYASNEYFAELYDVHKNTISLWINDLKNCGYIGTKILYKEDGKTVDKRIIFLSEVILREIAQNYCENNKEGINDFIDRYIRNHLDPINENSVENNTSINNNKNNNKEKTLFEIIEENFGRLLGPYEYDEIKTWKNTELTRYVIKEAILKDIRNVKYISRTLEDYRLKNITTIQQARDREEILRKSKNNYRNQKQEPKRQLSKWEKIRQEARKNNYD